MRRSLAQQLNFSVILVKNSMLFPDELFKCVLLLFTSWPQIIIYVYCKTLVHQQRQLPSRRTKDISYKITEIWNLQSVISSPLENVSTPLYHQLSVALNFSLMSLSHAQNQHSVTRRQHFSPDPIRIALWVNSHHMRLQYARCFSSL